MVYRTSFLLCLIWLVAACGSVPLTGRRQLLIFPESEMVQMSLSSYGDFLKNSTVSKDRAGMLRVKEVGERIAAAVEKYMRDEGMSSLLQHYNWEFNLVSSAEMNAWCMPGGKVVVYEGLLPVCTNDDALAVVMGHEIAHAVARHGNERMSQQMLVQAGSAAAARLLDGQTEEMKAVLGTALGLGANYGIMLPFSRRHELEADRLGLIFMTMAGFNPEEAIPFWNRMSAMASGQKPPEFMSTHPSDGRRIEQIRGLLPELEKYRPEER